MDLVYVVIGLAALQVYAFSLMVGIQRGKRGIAAPATTGDEVFERYHRVHYNSMEMLIVFIPAVFLFGSYISVNWAAGLGLLYLVSRFMYLSAYIKDPKKRAPGYGLGWLVTSILLLGGIGGAVWSLLS